MRAPPNAKGAALAQPSGPLEKCSATKPNEKRNSPAGARAQALQVIGSVKKSHASQLRVAISEWRGERKLELREATCLFGEIFYPAGVPLTIDVEQIDELIALLEAARAAA